MKAIWTSFFVVSRQKACIKNITEPDLPENKSSGKSSATIISCDPGSLPKPENLFSLLFHQIKILASDVLFFRLRLPLTLTVSRLPLNLGSHACPLRVGFHFSRN